MIGNREEELLMEGVRTWTREKDRNQCGNQVLNSTWRKKSCIVFSGMVDKTIRIGSLQVGSEVEDIPRMDFILIQEIKVLCKEPQEWG